MIFTASPTGSYLWSTGATMKSITVLIAGEYRVTVTATNTCSAVSAPTTVTVNPLPDMPTIFPPGPVILCQGDSATLTASFENSWSWNTGATTQSVNISAPGNYSVVVTNANSCSATSASTSVSLLPVVQSSVSLTIEYSGNDATVTAIPTQGGANPTFQWWLNDVLQTATGPVLQVSNGLPTWVVSCQMTSNDDCALPAQKIDTTLTDIVGASEPILPEKFRISPNPSSGFFTVEFFLPEAKMVVQRVLNVLGQVVWTASPRLEAGEFYRAIDLGPAVTPGIYLLETRLDGRAFLRKIEVR